MENLNITIGKRLLELRKKTNKTQKEVADDIDGFNVQMISSYEKGKQKPGIKNLLKFANYYKVSLDYLCNNVSNQKLNLKFSSFFDVLSAIISLESTRLFDIEDVDYEYILNGVKNNDQSGHKICIKTKNIHIIDFFVKYKKIKEAKEILGDQVFYSVVNDLLKSYDFSINN